MTTERMPSKDQGRPATGLDVSALVLAIVVPPAGIVVSIVDIVRTRRSGVHVFAKVALVLSIILTVVYGVGGGFGINAAVTAAQNAELCAAFAKYPDILAADGVVTLQDPKLRDSSGAEIKADQKAVTYLIVHAPEDSRLPDGSNVQSDLIVLNEILNSKKDKDWSGLGNVLDDLDRWDSQCQHSVVGN